MTLLTTCPLLLCDNNFLSLTNTELHREFSGGRLKQASEEFTYQQAGSEGKSKSKGQGEKAGSREGVSVPFCSRGQRGPERRARPVLGVEAATVSPPSWPPLLPQSRASPPPHSRFHPATLPSHRVALIPAISNLSHAAKSCSSSTLSAPSKREI